MQYLATINTDVFCSFMKLKLIGDPVIIRFTVFQLCRSGSFSRPVKFNVYSRLHIKADTYFAIIFISAGKYQQDPLADM